jgi:hypothetical protein
VALSYRVSLNYALIHATAALGIFAMTATSGNSIIGTTTGWHGIREDMLFHNLKLPI